ncbi:MAG TPA: alpha/beta hydrolase, partial [Pilimelia sp.]|nr:alpha/beta hydrolase [Pilimelia sp.]
MEDTQRHEVPTPRGPARVDLRRPPVPATCLLALGHGAGGGV